MNVIIVHNLTAIIIENLAGERKERRKLIMNKLFNKIATGIVSIAMAIGVGVVAANNRNGTNLVLASTSGNDTITYSNEGISNGTSVAGTAYDIGSYFKVTITKENAVTNPTYYDSGSAVRCYATKNTSTGNKITVTRTSAGADVSAYIITVTYAGTHNKKGTTGFTYTAANASGTSKTASSTTSTSATYTEANAVTTASAQLKETGNSNNGQFYLTSVRVDYVYTISTYSVTYNANNATSGTVPTDATAYNKNATVTVKGNTGSLARTGYTFGGWNTRADGTGSNYTAGSGQFSITDNTTLYAKWNPTTYNITYALNDGTHGSMHPNSGTYDTAFYVSAPTKDHYTFTGWTVTSGLNTSTAKWGTTSSPDTAISSSSTLCVNGASGNVYFKNINAASTAVTLTANWSINSYTVGGTISDGHLSSTADVDYNDPLSITIVPDQDYTYPSSIDSVTMGGDAYAGYTYDSTDGSFYIEHVTGNVVIDAACVSTSAIKRFFDYHLTNCSIENAPESMYNTEMKVLQIVADDHYKFPSSITVTGISDDKWDYDADEGTILINEPDGDIDLTVTCVAKVQNTINMGTLTGVTAAGGNPTQVEEGASVTLSFTSNSNYQLPGNSGVTVTGAESSNWSRTSGNTSGTLVLTGGTSGSITVSIAGVQKDLESISLSTPKTSYTLGDDFVKPTVTASFNFGSDQVVTDDAVVTGPITNGVVSGSGTVRITYTYEETGTSDFQEYTITASTITPSAGGIAKVTSTSDLTVGSTVYLVCEGRSKQLSGISTTSTKYGLGDDSSGTIAFKNSSNNYLYWTSGNSLNENSTLSDNTSWTVTISSGNATILNVADSGRQIMWNYSSPRFACYSGQTPTYDTAQGYNMVQLYKNYPAVVKTLKWITAEVKSGTYYKGTSVTASNFTVTGHYDDGSIDTPTTGITVTNGELTVVGTNNVTLTYGGKSCVVPVTASQAPVSTITLDPTSASIGLDESYYLSDIGVTVSPSYAIQSCSWELYNAGGLVEDTDYTFDGDEYHSINPGTVVFRCTSTTDENKYADFTLTIIGTPEAEFAKDSTSGYVGKTETISFTYMNFDASDIAIVSGNTSYVTIGTISASEGSGTVVINFVGDGTTSVTISDGNSTLDTLSVTAEADSVTQVTWSASNIDVYSGATLSTTGWNVQYEMASGDSGDADSYTIKLVGQTTETITAGYAFKAEDDGKTIHVEYQNVSSSSIDVKVTQTIHSVIAEIPGAATTYYQLVESNTDLEAGRYLIVSIQDSLAFDGSLNPLDAGQNNFAVTITDDDTIIADDSTVAGKYFDLTVEDSAWTITSASGLNVGHSVTGNGMNGIGTNSISISNGTATILGTGGKGLAYNSTSGSSSERFRYYTSPTSGKNHAVSLFKLTTEYGPSTPTEIANVVAHKEAQRVAVKFAKAFNAAMDETENCTTGLDAAWTTCSNAYNTFKTEAAALGETEEAYAKYYIQYATCAWSDDSGEACIERMLRTYKACVQIHKKNPFMNDLVTVKAAHHVEILGNIAQNANSIISIVVALSASVAAIGGYFFLRKKKED